MKLNKFLELRQLLMTHQDILSEVKLGNAPKAAGLLSKTIGKRMGEEFYFMGQETYKNEMSKGVGYRFMSNSGAQIRLNFDDKVSSKDFCSVNYWAADNTNITLPTSVVRFDPKMNVVQVVKMIADALVGKSIKGAELVEKRTVGEKQAWLKARGLPASWGKSERVFKNHAEEKGILEEAMIFLNGSEPETNSLDTEVKNTEALLSSRPYADPDLVFDDIEELLKLVKLGQQKSFLILGSAGLGKTYHITESPNGLKTLGPEGDKWIYHSGIKAAPFSFYKTLFSERKKIIVFDEADSILLNPDIVVMLKSLLDTSGKNTVEYMAGTKNMVGMTEDEIKEYSEDLDTEIEDGKPIGINPKKHAVLPSKFFFEGSMVFISNLPPKKVDEAVLSRSLFMDIHLSATDTLKRITSIALAQGNAMGESKEETYELIEALGGKIPGGEDLVKNQTLYQGAGKSELTIRSLTFARKMRNAGLKDWERLAKTYA